MEKRKLEKLGIETSLLGFGCMRFPTLPDGKIDEAEAERMLDKAIASGVNYIDTAYPYHNGESEPLVGKVLKKYDRSSFFLATKLPLWAVNSVDDAKRIFEEQLQRLQTDYIDFYLLHAVNKEKWDAMKELGVVEYCAKLKEEGKIRYYGFSFHDDYEVFDEILHYRDWDFCQIQYNYMDTQEQAGDKGYALAESLGVPLVIMEPIKGEMCIRDRDGVEPWEMLAKRAFWTINKLADACPESTIAVVSHGAWINALLAVVSGHEIGSGKTRLKNACISMLYQEKNKWEIGFYNLTGEDIKNGIPVRI